MPENLQELENQLEELEQEYTGVKLDLQLQEALKSYRGDDEIISFQKYRDNNKNIYKRGFSSGLLILDDYINGFQKGDLITVTAPTGHGKTSFCQFLTTNFSNQKIKSLWFSYEMPINNFLFKFGNSLPDGYLPKVLTDRNITWIERKVVEGIVKYNTGVVFIDHLHYLFNLRDSKNVSLEIGDIMRNLKIIAKKYNVTIFIVAHTGKMNEDGTVGLESIRDSSFVGQESDTVIALWRVRQKQTKIQRQQDGIQYTNETMVSVVKNRSLGTLGSFKTFYSSKNNNYLMSVQNA